MIIDIEKYVHFFSESIIGTITHIHNIVLICIRGFIIVINISLEIMHILFICMFVGMVV